MDIVYSDDPIWECQKCGKKFNMDTYDGIVCDHCGGEIKKTDLNLSKKRGRKEKSE